MKTINTIGADGCACGDYESDNLKAEASCRKSGDTPMLNDETYHLIQYTIKKDGGENELGPIIDYMFAYGADYIRVEKK